MNKIVISGIVIGILLILSSKQVEAQEGSSDDLSIYSGALKGLTQLAYPELNIIYSDNPSREYLFTTISYDGGYYLYIADNQGNILFFRKMNNVVVHLQAHQSGFLSYYDFSISAFIVLDSYYNPVDTLFMKNGFTPDMHELVLCENGDRWMLAFDNRIVDMSEIVEGGESAATVKGMMIQKLDMDDKLLFEWSSWDHYEITDTHINLVGSHVIDYVHGNSIDVDSDTSIIISCRNLSEISRINTKTGEFIWRLGGKNNQFKFTDYLYAAFSGQHSAVKLESGRLLLYDNGIESGLSVSRGAEYELDEENLTINLVEEFVHDPQYFALIKGNIQRLENDHTFIYWGSIYEEHFSAVSEYDENGVLTYEATVGDAYLFDYRVYRSTWESSVFSTNIDTLSFTQEIAGQPDNKEFTLTNSSEKAIWINYLSSKDTIFKIEDELPVQINPGGQYNFNVRFQSDTVGDFSDIINVGYQTDTSLISTRIFVYGTSSVIDDVSVFEEISSVVYPNPFSDNLTINSVAPMQRIVLSDLHGKVLFNHVTTEEEISFRTEGLTRGVYILTIISSGRTPEKKLVIKK